MKATGKSSAMRWTILGIVLIVLLFAAGVIYAQGRGERGFGRGEGFGMGMGPGGGPGGGPGMGPGGGMAMLMMDDEIRELMGEIRIIGAINELGLTEEQVGSLKECAGDAQQIKDREFEPLKEQVRDALRGQLNAVLGGAEFDPDALHDIHEQFADSHEPGAVRDELDEVVVRALAILTDEQREKLTDMEGPRGEVMRERIEDRMGQGGPGGRFFEGLSDEQRAQLEEIFRDRMGGMRDEAVKMKIMMLLLAPESIDAFDLWLGRE